jgi:hypothetical protein
MSSVNNTAHVNNDNATLNTLHPDNLDLFLSTNLSCTATFSEVWLNIINLCYDGFYRWFYMVAIIFQVCLTDQIARARESLVLVVYLLDFLYGVLNLATCALVPRLCMLRIDLRRRQGA